MDDPRVGSIENLRARGIQPKAIKEIIFALGINPSDATISVDALYDANRKLIDPKSVHVTLLPDPTLLEVQYCPAIEARIPWHPDFPEKGEKAFPLHEGNQSFYVSKQEVGAFREGDVFRLRNAYNVKLKSYSKDRFFAEFIGEQKTDKPTVLWMLEKGIPVEITLPDAKILHGWVESAILELPNPMTAYFEKTGYAVITSKSKSLVKALYAHR